MKKVLGRKGAKQTVEQGVTQPPIDVVRRMVLEILEISSVDEIERCARKKHGTGCLNTLQANKNSCTLFPSVDEKLLKFSKAYYFLMSHTLISNGLYALFLEPWFEVFGSDLLVVSTDGLAGDNFGKTMNSIFSHIGLSPYEVPHNVCTDVFKFCFL